MNEQEQKHLLTMSQACRHPLLKRNGKDLSRSVLERWSKRKVRGHKLNTWLVGGLRMTSEEDLRAFLDAINGRTIEPNQTDCKSSHTAAMRDLEAAGI